MPPWDAAEVASLAGAAPTADQIRAIEQETATYRRIIAEGGRLATGTDAPLTPVGLHLHLVLRALHRYGGLTVAQTLRTATSVPAELFGAGDDLGAVTEGRIADLVAVGGDPFTDFEALVRTEWAMRDGILYRSADGGRVRGAACPARCHDPGGDSDRCRDRRDGRDRSGARRLADRQQAVAARAVLRGASAGVAGRLPARFVARGRVADHGQTGRISRCLPPLHSGASPLMSTLLMRSGKQFSSHPLRVN
jgi:hypothetical protein